MNKLHLITGGSGLIGSHVAEILRKRNEAVRALVMPSSDTTFLKSINVELAEGDLFDVASVQKAVDGVDVVYHCAAFVGDWGAWRKFERGTVATTENLVQACRTKGQPRLVHISSISVYGRRPGFSEVTEASAIGTGHWIWDYYGVSKVMAERKVREYPDHVIVRPGWTFGPRDRASLPRLIESLRQGRFRILGRGNNPLNMVHASDVARGIIAAGETAAARGQAYNLCGRGDITQQEMADLLCLKLGLPKVRNRVPQSVAWNAGFLAELAFRLVRASRPPPVTRRAVYLLCRSPRFSIEKAARELDWRPEIPMREGLEDAVAWRLARERNRTTT